MKIDSNIMIEDIRRIEKLMKDNGIKTNKKTGRKFFTGYQYSTLYDWDQYFEGIVQLYVGWDCTYLKNAIKIFLDYQEDDGFIRRAIMMLEDGEFYEEQDEMVKPFLAQIALLIYKREWNIKWLNGYYDKLKKYMDHWLFDKDANKNNLSTWNSGPHTGMDNQHERAGWWKDCISEGVDLNCYLYRECISFSVIANLLGKKEDEIYYKDIACKIKEAVRNNMWNEEDGFFYDLNVNTGEQIKVKSIAGFATLWAGIASKEQAERLVSEHLLNPNEFWRPYPLPALAASEEGYVFGNLPTDLGCSWRAHTWVPTNYYVFQGLRKYGYDEIAKELAYKTYQLVKKSGDREYYGTEEGCGCGLDPFWGWSLLGYFMPMEYELNYDPTSIDLKMTDAFGITGIMN